MIKVAIIGAGSAVFAHRMITDILAVDGLSGGTFALVDIDAERLELAHQIAELTIKRAGKPWTVQATTDRKAILPDCDYVISTIEVAGLANVRHDYDIPLKYGIDQCIGDTIGPGGVFKYLRTAPAWLDIVRDVQALCPRAVVINYTNPMSALVLAAVRAAPSLSVVGLCHSVQGTSRQLAGYMGISYDDLRYTCGGINHLAWFTELELKGEDLYPRLRAAAADPAIYDNDPVRFEMMLHFGAFVTESSGHFSEYVPYFRKRPDLIAKYIRGGYRGESGFYANNWPMWRAAHDDRVRDWIKQEQRSQQAIDLTRSHEYGSEIIEAHQLNRPKVIYGNVANTGLIDNLPADGCVEVACLVDRNGIQPTHFGRLPTQLAALDSAHMMVHDLMAQAVLNEDREAAVYALLLDPLTAAVCSPAEIRQMFDEMAEAEQEYLPHWVNPKAVGALA
ncbi:MAG: alpha-galactosidase [Anaerolineae bacterium]|nr:alpha-galactosidase [Anaerolineae bacterium]